ncbi:MAG: GMC family oxidoreductase [Acidobacteria bacterium]|nr:GMC family oxidoreductase [Acidobacteriota bacterium]
MQIIRSPEVYDVVIVGSGAGRGMAAKVLADGGLKVAVLEAGGPLNPAKDYYEHAWPYQFEHRGLRLPQGRAGFAAPNLFTEIDGEPYTVAEGEEFYWFRSRIVGGRTNHWGRISLRYAPYYFKPYSTDGYGFDWPITYEDVAPYYDKTEAFIGVFGTKEGIPTAPDGIFLPPPKPRCVEVLIQRACDKLRIPCIPARMAIITRPLNGRAACHYCGQCGRGCVTASNFSSSQVLIFPALKSGRLTLLTNAMAREVVTNGEGKVTAVSYVDTNTRAERQVRCRAVVLAASACESARLLLNSKSSRFPNGLANGSGTVGRYLTDTVGAEVGGVLPQLSGLPPHNHDGIGGMHLYTPWWLYEKDRKPDFPRGYHIEFGGGPGMPRAGMFRGAAARHEGYGAQLKQALRADYGIGVGFAGRGEMIPNEKCYCEIDPNVVDRFGIPVLRFHWQWGEPELKMARHMRQTFEEIITAMGGKPLPRPYKGRAGRRGEGHEFSLGSEINPGGSIIHEIGCTRMGDDPKTSVLNKYCQAHEVKNLFVADGGPFVGNPDKNPTLTILALSWRTSDYILDQAKKGNL